MVFIYRNLHKPGRTYSVKCKNINRVIDHFNAEEAVTVIDNATFKVSKKGRDRVIREKKKYVHAGVQGTYGVTPSEWLYDLAAHGLVEFKKVKYNPYKNETFVTENGEPIHAAKWAVFEGQNVYAVIEA